MNKQLALVLNGPKDFSYEEKEIKRPVDDEVMIKVHNVSVCGSDVNAINGRMPLFEFPRIIGHEVSGVVEEVGGKASNLKVGDRVCLMPCKSCEHCLACRHGEPNACESLKLYGVKLDGGLQQYLTLPEKYFLRLPDSVSIENASLVEPLTIGMHATSMLGEVKGDKVLVLGAGPIGLCCAQVLKAKGAEVYCADASNERIAFVEERFGFKVFDVKASDYKEVLKKTTGGEGFYGVVDTTGNINSMRNAYQTVGQTGKVVLVGINKEDMIFNEADFHYKEATLFTTRNSNIKDYQAVLELIANGSIKPEKMITHRTKFSEAKDEMLKQAENPSKYFKHIICLVSD